MRESHFYQFGHFIFKMRWVMIALWIAIVLACLPLMPKIISPFKTTGFIDEQSNSAKTSAFMTRALGYSHDNQFSILYSSNELRVTEPEFTDKMKKSLAGLKHFSVEHEVIYPDLNSKQQVSKDGHSAYVVVIVKRIEPLNDHELARFKSLIRHPSEMSVQLGGEAIFVETVDKQTQKDLFDADFIATPVAIVTLILVFGSIVAALLPILLGGSCALLILTTLYVLGHMMTLSVFTLNIALLLGLCLSLDYALFIISRFRDELKRGLCIEDAIAVTQATAGKAIFFSGMAVFVSLSALLLFPINILFSMAVGGLTAVFLAVMTAVVFLPAILSVLNTKINLLSVKYVTNHALSHFNFWHWLAEKVVRTPWRCLLSILVVLLVLSYPFTAVKFGISDYKILPEHSSGRSFFDTFAEEFGENELTPISLVVHSNHSILSKGNLAHLYDFVERLSVNPHISQVNSIVNIDSQMTKEEYYSLYHLNKHFMPDNVKQLLATTTGKHFTVISVMSKYPANSHKTYALIDTLRTMRVGGHLTLDLTGTPVNNQELLRGIAQRLPVAMIWIMVFTYFILLLLLRSLFLPLKAIVMNMLSLSACYGVLVLVFQEGYLDHLLNFQAQGMLDISLVVIIFCALFGFSMDYEVFLLSRMKELYDETQDNIQSIVFGIEKSSRIITSAAIIVIFLCCSFLVADVLMVKAFGLGIAIAIFVDAFLIRTILVPATMTLIGKWNWYLPEWMGQALARLYHPMTPAKRRHK